MKILLVGGGSGGPVAPLLAVAEEIKRLHPKTSFLLVGTKNGPERAMAEQSGIPFTSISAGKLKRYFSFSNVVSPFLTLTGFFQSVAVLRRFKPDCVFGAGSFVQVPCIWAAWVLKIPVVIHQQDVYPSLANTLCQMAAKKITVTFEDSLTDFGSAVGLLYKKPQEKIVLTGNPFRANLKLASREEGLKFFGLLPDLPTLLVLGGGTGSEFINSLVLQALPQLAKSVQIIHSTGKGKFAGENGKNYKACEFIAEMGLAYAAADIVLCRAGLSTITELSNLGKLSIIIPIPDTHQELNAYLLMEQKAAIVAVQEKISPEGLVRLVRRLLFEHEIQQEIKENVSKIMPKNARHKIAEIILKLTEKK